MHPLDVLMVVVDGINVSRRAKINYTVPFFIGDGYG
jgi:hypothetical protein